MELLLNLEKFEKRQSILTEELTKSIKVKLTEAGLEPALIEELTLSISFSVTSIIDGISGVEADGVEVHPFLAFQDEDDLVHCGENSYMHELIYDVVGKLSKK